MCEFTCIYVFLGGITALKYRAKGGSQIKLALLLLKAKIDLSDKIIPTL